METIAAPNQATSYAYDILSNLTTVSQGSQTRSFVYDSLSRLRYGNRNFDEANTTTVPKNCGASPNFTVCTADVPVVNPTIDITKNRLNGYTYDSAGNTTKDAQSRKFTYDAENKQTKVETVDANGNSISTLGEYFYDGDGKRVKKIAGNEITIFVYDAGGKLVAEYAN